MFNYHSRRHRSLMDESEQALSDAAQGTSAVQSRAASQVLNDPKTHRLWESQHADLLSRVAPHRNRERQVIAMRSIEASLLHRRALIDHIRKRKIVGAERDQLFRLFYGPKDVINAMVTEHRRYILAVSSYVSVEHLINVMHDSVSTQLLAIYESAYQQYFDLYCVVAGTEDTALADVVGPMLLEARNRATRVRERLKSIKPDNRFSNFDREAILARSGQYPMHDYMVG
ncbi:MAG: hypothetical protein WBN34_12725 [Woeseia sp.]